MQKTIGIIGHFGGNKNFTDGQTVKTKEINRQIEQNYGIKTEKFDTYRNSHNPLKLLGGVFKIVKNNNIVILIVSQRGYKIISILLIFFNLFFHRKLYDFVIGGTRYRLYDSSKIHKIVATKFNKIYVETQRMKNEYEKRKIMNVMVFPNFKDIKVQSSININKNYVKLCTFTRVIKEKGIVDAINSVKIANEKLEKKGFCLDIYGPVDKSFETEFYEALQCSSEFVKYQGIVEPNKSTDVIKQYDLMLFLTYWPSEGFPGTILDSFSAGVPVIATDWNCNFEIVKENYTGFKVSIHDFHEVANILIDVFFHRDKIIEMKNNCLNESKKYLPEKIMQIFYDEID